MSKKVLVTSSSRLADKDVEAMAAFLEPDHKDYMTRQVLSLYGGLC